MIRGVPSASAASFMALLPPCGQRKQTQLTKDLFADFFLQTAVILKFYFITGQTLDYVCLNIAI